MNSEHIPLTQDWSMDGRFLLYSEIDVKNGRDLWALPVTGGDRKPPRSYFAPEVRGGFFRLA